uniref:Uncharacterized protein n=1 Tax=Globodera rostochiensis TaxID=31243 RepID=A0A914HTL0_GLORO
MTFNKSDYAIGTMAIPSSHKQLPKSCMRNGGGKYVNGLDRQRQNVAAERVAYFAIKKLLRHQFAGDSERITQR